MGQYLDQLDEAIEEYKQHVIVGEALERLMNNSDFKLVFLDLYLEKAPGMLAKNMASPDAELQDSMRQKYFKAQLSAIGHFYHFLNDTKLTSEQAASKIMDYEQERINYLNEEDN